MENYSPRWEGKTTIRQPRPRVPLEKSRKKYTEQIPSEVRQKMLAKVPAWALPYLILQVEQQELIVNFNLPANLLEALEPDQIKLIMDRSRAEIKKLLQVKEDVYQHKQSRALQSSRGEYQYAFRKIQNLGKTLYMELESYIWALMPFFQASDEVPTRSDLYDMIKVLEQEAGVDFSQYKRELIVNTLMSISDAFSLIRKKVKPLVRTGAPLLDEGMVRRDALKKLRQEIEKAKKGIHQLWTQKGIHKKRRRPRPKPTPYANRQREAAQDIRDLEVGGDRAIDPTLKITNVHQMILQVRSNVMRRTAKNRLNG